MAVKELIDKKRDRLVFLGSVLVNSRSYVSRMIRACFIVIVALHHHCIGGMANQHLTKCENLPAKITV